jgi:hypothetical protein
MKRRGMKLTESEYQEARNGCEEYFNYLGNWEVLRAEGPLAKYVQTGIVQTDSRSAEMTLADDEYVVEENW